VRAVLGQLVGWAAGPEEHLTGKAKEFGVHRWTSEIMGHTAKMGCAACKASWAERGSEMGQAFGLGPERMDKIFFSNLFLMQNNSRKSRNCFKDTKNTRKIPKIPGKFPEAQWDMNHPNKVFGVHEKDFIVF
jgi:hypothetical protein